MVGQNPERQALGPTLGRERILPAEHLLGTSYKRQEEVGVIGRRRPLKDRRDPFQAGPGVDRWSRQRVVLAPLSSFELHEDEIPDLHEQVGLAGGQELLRVELAGRARGSEIVVQLRARATWTGFAHLPEVLFVAQPEDSLRRQLRALEPEVVGLVISVVNRRPDAVHFQAQVLGHELPGVRDRLGLEVVPEGEVAQHLEEGVMPGRHSHLFEVVVLSAHA